MKGTTDIWMAGYLIGAGHAVAKVEREGKRYKFYFELDGDSWQAAKIRFSQSEDSKIKYRHETLKDLIYQ